MSEKKKPDSRARNFATVVYPESAPEGWLDKLTELMIPAFVSPLHDKDENPGGEPKKLHHHVIVMFEGKKSNEQIQEIFDLIGGVGLEVVKSIRGYARYLCHLDNPEKAQYSPDEVRSFCGADYMGTIGLPIDKYKAIGDMMQFVKDEGITAYSDLLDYSLIHRPDWFRTLCDNGSYVMKEYIKSYSWKVRKTIYGDTALTDDFSGENYIN